jgi:type II secretory pathway pseudopilin PulG
MTIVEVMIVVTIIGILAVIAIPNAVEARHRARDTVFMNEVRQVTGNAFQLYGFEYGDFPEDAAPGVEPINIAEYLPKYFDWTEETPIGGKWDWERAADRSQKVHGIYAGLQVFEPGRTSGQMNAIDKAIDDGDPFTGVFRKTTVGYIFVLEY